MVLVSFDSEKLVRVYSQLAPVIEEAYQELLFPGTKFQEILEEANAFGEKRIFVKNC